MEFIMSNGLAIAWVKKTLSKLTELPPFGELPSGWMGMDDVPRKLMRRPRHAPGMSASTNGWRPSGIPLSDAASQITSYTEWLKGFQSSVGFGRIMHATMPGNSPRAGSRRRRAPGPAVEGPRHRRAGHRCLERGRRANRCRRGTGWRRIPRRDKPGCRGATSDTAPTGEM